MILIALQMAQEAQGGAVAGNVHFLQVLGQQKDSAMLMAWISGGSVLGGVLSSVLCAKRINTNIALYGGVGITLSCLALVFLPYGCRMFYAALALAGMTAAGYLVPLNALLQDHADDDKRGDVIAAGNLVDCGLGIMSVVLQGGMRAIGMSTQMQCGALALSAIIVTAYLSKNLRSLNGHF